MGDSKLPEGMRGKVYQIAQTAHNSALDEPETGRQVTIHWDNLTDEQRQQTTEFVQMCLDAAAQQGCEFESITRDQRSMESAVTPNSSQVSRAVTRQLVVESMCDDRSNEKDRLRVLEAADAMGYGIRNTALLDAFLAGRGLDVQSSRETALRQYAASPEGQIYPQRAAQVHTMYYSYGYEPEYSYSPMSRLKQRQSDGFDRQASELNQGDLFMQAALGSDGLAASQPSYRREGLETPESWDVSQYTNDGMSL